MDTFRVSNLSKNYTKKNVLFGVSISLEEGNVIGLIGNNGVGKTTLLSILSGFIPLEKGNFYFNNRKITHQKFSENVAFINDNPFLPDHLTVKELLKVLLLNYFKEAQKPSFLLENILDLLSINPNIMISKLSKGQRQRLVLGSLIATDKKIILLDEPTLALDLKGISIFSKIISKLKDMKKIIVISSHDLSSIEFLCNQIYLLEDSSLKEITSCQESEYSLFISFKSKINSNLFDLLPSFQIINLGNHTYKFSSLNKDNNDILFILKWIYDQKIEFNSIQKINLSRFYNQEFNNA
jgi:ABC-type multidrug transport system ATPase subunit